MHFPAQRIADVGVAVSAGSAATSAISFQIDVILSRASAIVAILSGLAAMAYYIVKTIREHRGRSDD